MEYRSLEQLRQHVLDVIEDRLAESPFVPSAAPGHEFFFLASKMVILDTGMRARLPSELAARVPRIPTGSVYYHFVEGRRRPPPMVDDFSAWLAGWGSEYERCRASIAAIDYHLWSLTEMRNPLVSRGQLQNCERVNKGNARRLSESLAEAGYVFIHDPQPAGLLHYEARPKGKWIWRCHIDVSRPHRPVWKYLRELVRGY